MTTIRQDDMGFYFDYAGRTEGYFDSLEEAEQALADLREEEFHRDEAAAYARGERDDTPSLTPWWRDE